MKVAICAGLLRSLNLFVDGLLDRGLPCIYDFIQSRCQAVELPLSGHHYAGQAAGAHRFLEITKGPQFLVVLLIKHHGWLSLDDSGEFAGMAVDQ